MARKKKPKAAKAAKKAAAAKPQKALKVPIRATAEQRVWALLSYICVLFILPLIFRKDDSFVHFHAKQGLVFFIAGFASAIILLIPVIGWVIGALLIIVLAAFWALAVIHALFGEMWKMPLIGRWAEEMKL